MITGDSSPTPSRVLTDGPIINGRSSEAHYDADRSLPQQLYILLAYLYKAEQEKHDVETRIMEY